MALLLLRIGQAGWVPIEGWRERLAGVPRWGLLGADARAYPRDFASFARTHAAFEALPSRVPMPDRLTLVDLGRFLAEHAHRYRVRWEPGHDAAASAGGASAAS